MVVCRVAFWGDSSVGEIDMTGKVGVSRESKFKVVEMEGE
jgi:hypothetical protein